MKKKCILMIFGTRPEAIKMAPVIKELKKYNNLNLTIAVTEQHKEMLFEVLDLFDIQPDYHLDIMKHNQSLSELSANILKKSNDLIKKLSPDLVMVHGDTSSTLNAALAAFYNKIPICHVEAGLRSGNIYSPYPEEFNRKVVSSIATLHFAPTLGNKKNLINDGVLESQIHVTGNTVIDALHSVVSPNHTFKDPFLKNIDFSKDTFLLFTCHRRENWGNKMREIFIGIKKIASNHGEVKIIFPIHLNPAIRELANNVFFGVKNVFLIDPLNYTDFSNLMARVYFILTDSGGIQEEGPSLGKPVLVLREETERPEAVTAGTVKIIGIQKEDIFTNASILLNDKEEYLKMKNAVNPYGDGLSSERIVSLLNNFLISLPSSN